MLKIINEKKKINIILICNIFITSLLLLSLIISTILIIKLDLFSKIESRYKQNNYASQDEQLRIDKIWANKISKGGYILHFRHAEREKWIDVQMYDLLESDVHNNGFNNSRMAENDYFSKAVCLNDRGLVQAKAMGELLKEISFPIGQVISSPSCRSRQTANIAFGGYDKLDRELVHRGPYYEKEKNHLNKLKKIYLELSIENNKNTIVSSHNTVISHKIFDEINFSEKKGLSLEEGGFYVISNKNNKLVLEYEFHNFLHFIRAFYPR
tara:strand:- start:454 stop:1257 length:804 start_codon:yes stop_codon:yes gene_type:complete